MASQNFIGKGPSREILDLRENRKAMERIKDTFMTKEDLDELFVHLGIKSTKKTRTGAKQNNGTPTKKRPFVIADIDDVDNALKKFRPDPKAPYAYKTPKVKDPLKSKKPGRPTGSKKKRPNRNESLTSETSLDMSECELLLDESNSDDSVDLETEPTQDLDQVDLKLQSGRQLGKRKRVEQSGKERPKTRSSKRIKIKQLREDLKIEQW